ncbi:protein phosphatase 2C domain-containing protein [Streptomyces sp. NPDC047017]|uniref:protein phosphatase 2C domain-containing protein n=1 Tax=Streptomyces sp. NPDC047017 TaxID=3155024 RepID=UPI0033F948EA
MSQQGGRPTGHEADWWGQLYDDSAGDTGPTAAADSLDDRFASAADAVDAVDAAQPGGGAVDDPDEEWVRFDGDPPARGPAAAGTSPPAPAPWWEPAAPGPVPSPPGEDSPAAPPGGPGPSAPAADAPAPAGSGPDTPADEPSPATGWLRGAAPERGSVPLAPAPGDPPAPVDNDDHVGHVGSGPPTYDAEPTALPVVDPDGLVELVPDTVLDGARQGACTLRAASVRGDSPRYRGEPRRDALLTARFGTGDHALVLVAMATGARAAPGAHRAAAEACRWIAQAVGRSHVRLAEDIRAARRGELKSGLHRLTDRSLGRLRADAVEQGVDPETYAASLRCLLLPADPQCRVRVFFGVGAGGLFRLREGAWEDLDPPDPAGGDRLTLGLGIPAPPGPFAAAVVPAPRPPGDPFRFRASLARPGDTLLMCTGGLAEPLRGEPALGAHLAGRWEKPAPPGLAAFLADAQTRVKGYADDRTAAAVWEA